MGADGPTETDSIKRDLAGIIGDFLAGLPQAGARVFAPSQAGDARHARNEGLPCGRELPGCREDLDAPMFLPSVAAAVHRLVSIDRRLSGAERLDCLKKARLIVLDADQQCIASAGGSGESFFARAARRL
jgi:hypothetical protein